MHGFIKQLPDYRQAKSRGEREERERVLSLIRLRTSPARAQERRLGREMGAEAATANAGGGDEADAATDEEAPTPAERRAEARAEARGAARALEELERAVRNGWRR